MQTRKFHRTMSEAFKDADYASSVTVYRTTTHNADRIVMVSCAIAVVCLLAMIAVGWVK